MTKLDDVIQPEAKNMELLSSRPTCVNECGVLYVKGFGVR